jgi:hypothetical protein
MVQHRALTDGAGKLGKGAFADARFILVASGTEPPGLVWAGSEDFIGGEVVIQGGVPLPGDLWEEGLEAIRDRDLTASAEGASGF